MRQQGWAWATWVLGLKVEPNGESGAEAEKWMAARVTELVIWAAESLDVGVHPVRPRLVIEHLSDIHCESHRTAYEKVVTSKGSVPDIDQAQEKRQEHGNGESAIRPRVPQLLFEAGCIFLYFNYEVEGGIE